MIETIAEEIAFGKELLNKKINGIINEEEFDRECAYWMINYLDDLRFLPAPTEPDELNEYRKAKQEGKKISSGFWAQGKIQNFLKTESEICSKNFSNFSWLNFMKKNIPADDTTTCEKINHYVNVFKMRGWDTVKSESGEERFIFPKRGGYQSIAHSEIVALRATWGKK